MEIHFYKDNISLPDNYYITYNETINAINRNEKPIYTVSISALDFAWLLEKNYKIFLHENGKCLEIHEGTTAGSDKQIKRGHHINKIWIGGGFYEYFYE